MTLTMNPIDKSDPVYIEYVNAYARRADDTYCMSRLAEAEQALEEKYHFLKPVCWTLPKDWVPIKKDLGRKT